MDYRIKIKNYIASQLGNGSAVEAVKQELIGVGWERELVVEIIDEVASGERPPSPDEFSSQDATQPLSNRHMEIQPLNPLSLTPEPNHIPMVSPIEQEPASSATPQAEF